MTRTTRRGAGFYIVSDNRNEVEVSYYPHLRGWIAAARWDAYRYSDPVWTKREAVEIAARMLATADDF